MRAIFILHRKGVLLRDTCDYPTTSNTYSTRVSEPKLSDDMKENKTIKKNMQFLVPLIVFYVQKILIL